MISQKTLGQLQLVVWALSATICISFALFIKSVQDQKRFIQESVVAIPEPARGR